MNVYVLSQVLERISPTKLRIGLEHTAYLKEGIKLECQPNSVDYDSRCSLIVGPIKAQPIDIKVQAGDTLRLYRDNTRLGHSGNRSYGKPAGISCTHPDVIDQVMVDQSIHRRWKDRS